MSGELLTQAQQFIRHGLAIAPVLVKGQGEMTKLILSEQEVLLACSTQRFVQQVCHTLFLDFKTLQDGAKQKLGKKQLVPIPVTFHVVLFPLRCINPEQVKTRGFSWIMHRQVQSIQADPSWENHSRLTLSNGYRCLAPYSPHFLHQQIRDSYLMEYFFQQAHLSAPSFYRPALSGQAWKNRQDEWPIQIDHIADAPL